MLNAISTRYEHSTQHNATSEAAVTKLGRTVGHARTNAVGSRTSFVIAYI